MHDIINSEEKNEVKIRAISELHAMEVTLFTMWKQLPNLYVNNTIAANHVPVAGNAAAPRGEERGYEETQIPPVDEIDERNRFDRWRLDNKPMSAKYVTKMESKYGIRDGLWLNECYVKCSECNRWFETENIKFNHTCITPAATPVHSNRWAIPSKDNNSDNTDSELS